MNPSLSVGENMSCFHNHLRNTQVNSHSIGCWSNIKSIFNSNHQKFLLKYQFATILLQIIYPKRTMVIITAICTLLAAVGTNMFVLTPYQSRMFFNHDIFLRPGPRWHAILPGMIFYNNLHLSPLIIPNIPFLNDLHVLI